MLLKLFSGTRQRACWWKFHHVPRACEEAFWIYYLAITEKCRKKPDEWFFRTRRMCEIRRHLEQDVGGVVKQHDERADAYVVGAVGETQQGDGGQMMDHLLPKILVKKKTSPPHSVIFEKHGF